LTLSGIAIYIDLQHMKLMGKNTAAAMLAVAGLCLPANSLIVWKGKVVPEWPDQHLAALGKGSAGSPPAKTAAGAPFGFYSHPGALTYGVTMIVDFSDQAAAFTAAQVTDWLNKPGFTMGSTRGSVRDYFYEVSNGQLELTSDVYGYYRARHPKSWYEGLPGYTGSDSLVREMMNYFDPLVDFSKYDNDKNGTTEAVNFVYAGSGQTYAQGLWPHSGNVGQTRDGVSVGRYNMSDMGTSLTLYVFCHENGHMIFGWPDLYWFGDYCIMGNRMSDVNPQAVNDFYRADQGWIPTVDITASTNARYFAWHNSGGFRYINPSKPQEMFYWSKVRNTGRWSNLRGSGVLLYHFDYTLGGNTSGTRRSLFVVEADGNNAMANAQWPNPGSAAADFFYQANKAEFSSTTNPASLWGLRIYSISALADTMNFYVGTGPVAARQAGGLQLVHPAVSTGPAALFNLKGVRVGWFGSDGKMLGLDNRPLAPGGYVVPAPGKAVVTMVPAR
jgi:M6 family metalloprotease-like protein